MACKVSHATRRPRQAIEALMDSQAGSVNRALALARRSCVLLIVLTGAAMLPIFACKSEEGGDGEPCSCAGLFGGCTCNPGLVCELGCLPGEPCAVCMKAVSALHINVTGAGTVGMTDFDTGLREACPPRCDAEVAVLDRVQLDATPACGAAFLAWTAEGLCTLEPAGENTVVMILFNQFAQSCTAAASFTEAGTCPNSRAAADDRDRAGARAFDGQQP